MNYAAIKNCDIANGPGVRVSLFVSGCTHRCPGCFNEVAWDFDYGQPFTEEIMNSIVEMLRPSYIRGLTLLGGEPFEPQNQRGLLPFLEKVKKQFPHKNIWCYTGFTYEEVLADERLSQILPYIDTLVEGPFILELRNTDLPFRGSSNQRIINLR